jgi:hypothetical protein
MPSISRPKYFKSCVRFPTSITITPTMNCLPKTVLWSGFSEQWLRKCARDFDGSGVDIGRITAMQSTNAFQTRYHNGSQIADRSL